MGCSTFAEYTVMPEIALAKIDPEAPFEHACLFACGLSTGLGAAIVTAADGSISTSSGLTITVSIGAAAKLSLKNVTISAGSSGANCFFTCAITGLGSSGTVKANVAVTDSVGNPISTIGAGHAVKITATAGSTIAGTPLAIPSTGVAETAAQFTYTSKASGSFTDTITVTTSEGTAYTSAIATTSK